MSVAIKSKQLPGYGMRNLRIVHKIAIPYKDGRRIGSVFMLCKPSATGKNDETKSISWEHVTCTRCHLFKNFHGYGDFK